MSSVDGVVVVPCVGAVIGNGAGRIVVVRRRNPPSAGMWSIPGGRVEAGESLEEAVRREVREETGLDVEVADVAGRVDLPAPDGSTYAVTDFHCRPTDPAQPLQPGDDATDARWVDKEAFGLLELSAGLAAALDTWGIWTR